MMNEMNYFELKIQITEQCRHTTVAGFAFPIMSKNTILNSYGYTTSVEVEKKNNLYKNF